MSHDFDTAQQYADYWKEFRAGNHHLVLARYKSQQHKKRSRYSIFVFPNGGQEISCWFNFEPNDPEDFQNLEQLIEAETDSGKRDLLELQHEFYEDNPLESPFARFGEWIGSVCGSSDAPNDLTFEQFQPIAFRWAASQLGISVDEIVPANSKVQTDPEKKKWWQFWK